MNYKNTDIEFTNQDNNISILNTIKENVKRIVNNIELIAKKRVSVCKCIWRVIFCYKFD